VRARNIKPGFFLNEELADIEAPWGRLCFAGLWCMADREGRLEDRPRRIKAEVFPYDKKMPPIEKILTELAKKKFIRRYAIKDEKFIEINTFLKHQRPHTTERVSGLPAPLINGESTLINGESTLLNGGNPPDSLIPDSLVTPLPPPRGGNGSEPDFEEWWQELPPQMRKGQGKALLVWKRLRRRGQLPPLAEMLRVLKAQRRSEAWEREEGRFIPLPENYLAKRRFQDESAPTREPPEACKACRGSGFRRARRGEEAIDGQVLCECRLK
jgi:hypothetical protein